MRFTDCDMPSDEPTWGLDWSRPLSAWAGFFGAIPYGLGLWLVLAMVVGAPDGQMEVIHYLAVLLCFLPFLPFVVAATRIERDERPRVLRVIWAGLGVGSISILLLCFAGVVIIPAGALGLIFGLIALLPCWWRGDSAGRAMSLLGPAPAIMFFMFRSIERAFRGIRLDATSPTYPFLTNRQVAYAIVVVLIVLYASLLYWAFLRKVEPIVKTLKAAKSYAPFAFAGGITGGAVAGAVIGVLCLGIAALTHLDLYEYAVSSAITGAINGAMGGTVVAMSRNVGVVSHKLAAVATFLAPGLVLLAFWNWLGVSSIVLAGGLIGLYEGIVVGSRLALKMPTSKKLIDEL